MGKDILFLIVLIVIFGVIGYVVKDTYYWCMLPIAFAVGLWVGINVGYDFKTRKK